TRERLGMRRQATEDAWPPLDPLGGSREEILPDRLGRPSDRRVFLCIGAYIFGSGRAAASGWRALRSRVKGACGSLRLPVNSACPSEPRHAHARGVASEQRLAAGAPGSSIAIASRKVMTSASFESEGRVSRVEESPGGALASFLQPQIGQR